MDSYYPPRGRRWISKKDDPSSFRSKVRLLVITDGRVSETRRPETRPSFNGVPRKKKKEKDFPPTAELKSRDLTENFLHPFYTLRSSPISFQTVMETVLRKIRGGKVLSRESRAERTINQLIDRVRIDPSNINRPIPYRPDFSTRQLSRFLILLYRGREGNRRAWLSSNQRSFLGGETNLSTGSFDIFPWRIRRYPSLLLSNLPVDPLVLKSSKSIRTNEFSRGMGMEELDLVGSKDGCKADQCVLSPWKRTSSYFFFCSR